MFDGAVCSAFSCLHLAGSRTPGALLRECPPGRLRRPSSFISLRRTPGIREP